MSLSPATTTTQGGPKSKYRKSHAKILMRIEIDQSGKIEFTGSDTVLAYSNQKQFSILIPSVVKRELIRKYRQRGKVNKIFFLKLFCAGLFLLVKEVFPRIEEIVIDVEYEGNESRIKNILLNHIRKTSPNFDENKIVFRRIGKKSNAHKIAIDVFRENRKEGKMVKAEDLEELL